MAPDNRFDRLEPRTSSPLDPALERALDQLDRFDQLEIGDIAPLPPEEEGRTACAHCGRFNEEGRSHCWACYRLIGTDAPSEGLKPGFELILDGKRHSSEDPALPDDVRMLMGWIQKEGYSPTLISKWRQWRATRNQAIYRARETTSSPTGPNDVKLFRQPTTSILHINGRHYTSADKTLPPEVKALFDYLDSHEITPDLMDHLRRHGTKVKYRPSTTADPTDGDLSYWEKIKDFVKGPLLE